MDVYNVIRDIYGGSQCTGTSPVPAGKPTLVEIIGAFNIDRHTFFYKPFYTTPLDFSTTGDRL